VPSAVLHPRLRLAAGERDGDERGAQVADPRRQKERELFLTPDPPSTAEIAANAILTAAEIPEV
jgi:hypothetical protein